MVRALRRLRGEADFEWRGGDVSRLEALTDGVFALALTLLIVSLEMPTSFDDLVVAFQQIPAFAASFAILISFWVSHFLFHRRYGLEDGPTIALNAVLMFLILLYVYPLRFLATLLMEMFFDVGTTGDAAITPEQWPTLMLVYSGGYAGHLRRVLDDDEPCPPPSGDPRAQPGGAGDCPRRAAQPPAVARRGDGLDRDRADQPELVPVQRHDLHADGAVAGGVGGRTRGGGRRGCRPTSATPSATPCSEHRPSGARPSTAAHRARRARAPTPSGRSETATPRGQIPRRGPPRPRP